MADTIRPDQLGKEIGEVLQTFNHKVETRVDEAALECGRIGAAMLKEMSPRKSGKYAKSWDHKKTKRGTVYIHNKKHYRLTHLLENGHKTMFKHGRYGQRRMTRPNQHIYLVDEYVGKLFPDKVTQYIEKQK